VKKVWGAIFLLLLLVGFLGLQAGGFIGRNTDFTLRLVPPQNRQPPLQGTWQIVSLLKESTAANQELAQNWVGKNLYFAESNVLLGEYLLPHPRYRVKRVEAKTYLLSQQHALPEEFRFGNPEIEVITLSDNHLFWCELLRENDDKLLLTLFNNSYLVKKISDDVDATVFSSSETTDILEIGNLTETASRHTGVLLGLRASDQDRQGRQGEHYRTLWLALEDQKLAPVLATNVIVFPRKSGFYELEVVRKKEEKKEEDFLIVEHILGEEKQKDFEPSLASSSWEEKEGYIHRRIHYIGNDYVSIEETVKQTSVSDGSIKEESKLHIFTVDSLPGMKAVKITDLAGPGALTPMEQGKQNLLEQLQVKQAGSADEENFGLARKKGYWILKGRLSYPQNNVLVTADYDIDLLAPSQVVFYNQLNIPWSRVKNHVPNAIDALISPNKDLALVVTNKEIIVYGMYQENLEEHPLERIPLQEGEEVIMAEWALGQYYVGNWSLTFQTYLAQVK